MDRQLFALSLGFAACILFPDRAFGQDRPRCADRASMIGQLAERWGESRRAIGLAGNQAVLELYTSPTSGTFTLIASLPDGRACLVASGDHFELTSPEKSGAPA